MLMFNGIIVVAILILSAILSVFISVRFTDLVFIGAMIILAGAAAYFSIARREMRKAVRNKSKEEKKKYRLNFRQSEQYAFLLFASSVVLFIVSFLTAQ